MLVVRWLVPETVNLTQIFDDLIIDALEIFYLLRLVIKTAALVSHQLQSLAGILKHPLPRGSRVPANKSFRIEIDWNNQRIVVPDRFHQVGKAEAASEKTQPIVEPVSHEDHSSAPGQSLWPQDLIKG